MEARDIVKAKEMLAHDFEMTFPGTVVFHELKQLIDWSKPRYKSIGKTFKNLMTCPMKKKPSSIVLAPYQGKATMADCSRAFDLSTDFKL